MEATVTAEGLRSATMASAASRKFSWLNFAWPMAAEFSFLLALSTGGRDPDRAVAGAWSDSTLQQ
jgi:hypothetical protein